MKKTLLLSCLLLQFLPADALARPISYPGGWTVMQNNEPDTNSLHIHYSPTANYSVGYLAEYMQENDWQFHGVQLNNLLGRWNAPHSQANLYLQSGVGLAIDDGAQAATFTGVAFDWETRRYFTSYENQVFYAGDIDKSFTQKARVGIAPYEGDYGDLHTWLMLQVDHTPSSSEHFKITPLVRLFKGEYLAEAGVSNKGDVLLNWTIRF